MTLMADPMISLLKFQEQLDLDNVDTSNLVNGYMKMYDETYGPRFSVAKIIDKKVQAIAIFGLEEPLNGLICYSSGCAVAENNRRSGLAVEAMTVCLEELKNALNKTHIKNFVIEGMVDQKNTASLKLAEKFFSTKGMPTVDSYSKTPSMHFRKIIQLK